MDYYTLASKISVANIIEEGKLGGPQIRIARVAAALNDKIDTTVILPEENSKLFRHHCNSLGVHYKSFKLTRITKEFKVALRYLIFTPWELIQLIRFLKKKNFAIVHVSGGSWQYKGVIAGKIAGKKVLWHLNDTYVPYVLRKIFHLLSPIPDGYIYASLRSKAYYGKIKKVGKPEFVIPAPIDTEKFDPTKTYPLDKSIIQRWQRKIVIGTVANISPVKGLEVLIQTASALKTLNFDIVFAIVGPVFKNQNRYFKKLRNMCDQYSLNNIEFTGRHTDVRPYLQRFDFYVCSSNAESSPIAVWEAMAMEKPIISTNVGDVPIYVQNGYNGFIVDVGDFKAISDRIQILINDKGLQKKFGHRSRKIAIEKLDITKCATRHLDAYNTIVKNLQQAAF